MTSVSYTHLNSLSVITFSLEYTLLRNSSDIRSVFIDGVPPSCVITVDAIHWLRFPGGSTNTVSHRYGGRQIMQQLKAQAEQKGYAWIDWNVCAEDATASHPNAAQILRNVPVSYTHLDVYKRQGAG